MMAVTLERIRQLINKFKRQTKYHLATLLLLLCSSVAVISRADFYGPVEIYSDKGELNIEERANVVQDRVVLTLKNLEESDLHCEVHFMNGPELIIKRVGFVTAGKEILFYAPLRRTIVKIVVDYTCNAI
ncbi:hypothetical protein BTA51_26895 [Hahella sp. CCB-MM4]|uniref:hypothetical protein n=1 Tax=Hahella sp. (strain CCB-MM4) TaxID=1926491 RepID=UPI000B9C2F7B|nr:hypothetical protein [Hahella sp. CCB-MM4]OZG70232.1 hypothetical protein BTA51_26895 [Hahella sp. CCB-MM4]